MKRPTNTWSRQARLCAEQFNKCSLCACPLARITNSGPRGERPRRAVRDERLSFAENPESPRGPSALGEPPEAVICGILNSFEYGVSVNVVCNTTLQAPATRILNFPSLLPL